MSLFAEHSLMDILQVITTVVAVIIVPWVITVERRLSTLIAQGTNGLGKQLENLQDEIKSQRNEYGKRIALLEIAKARYEGGQAAGSDIHS